MDDAAVAGEGLEIVEVRGVKVPLDPAALSPAMVDVIRAGKYERGESRFLPGIVEPGERLLELGGGIGYLSALVGVQRKAERIVVVEANPALIPLIRRTHELNEVDAVVVNAVVAATKTAETLPFYIHHDFWASSLVPLKEKWRKGVVDLPVIAFNDLIAEHAPTLLIIDVEGSETELLQGVRLDGVRKALIEIHHKVIGQAGIRAVFEFFFGQGFCYDPEHSHGGVVLFRRMDEA